MSKNTILITAALMIFISLALSSSAINITITQPDNGTAIEYWKGTGVDFSFNSNDTSDCILFINDTQNRNISGTQSFRQDFGNNGTYKAEVRCTDGSGTYSEFIVLSARIKEFIETLSTDTCFASSYLSLLLFMVFVAIEMIMLVFSYISKVGLVGVLGGVMGIFISLYIYPCSVTFGIIYTAFALYQISFFGVKGYSGNL